MEIEARRGPFAPSLEQATRARKALVRSENLLYQADMEFECYVKTLGKLKQKFEDSQLGSDARDIAEMEVKSMRVAIIDHIDKINKKLECLEYEVLESNYDVVTSVRSPSGEVFNKLGLDTCTEYQYLRNLFY